MDNKPIPSTLNECTAPSPTVNGLFNLAEKIQKIGNTLLAITIISGLITTIVNFVNLDPDIPATITAAVVSLVFTIIGGILVYILVNYLVQVLCGLGETTFNTGISAKLALMEAAQSKKPVSALKEPVFVPDSSPVRPAPQQAPEPPVAEETILPDSKEKTKVQKQVIPEGAVEVRLDYGNIVCPVCKIRQPGSRKVCDNCGVQFVVIE